MITPLTTRLGWIGTGVMGSSMCGHLVQAGYRVTVHNRTKAKAHPILERGAAWAENPQAVAAGSDVLFTMVGFPAEVRDCYLGESGIFRGVKAGTILIDMTTTAPSLSRELAERAAALDCTAIDAPVSGGDVGARQATLSIMIGGKTSAVQTVMPLLELLGKKLVHQGSVGAGQHAKLCNQLIIASTMVGACESLLYGFKAGLNLDRLLQSISGGAAACWTLDHLAPRILQRDFEPGFFVEHFVKDMGLALEESKRMNLTLPGLTLAQGLYQSVMALGHGRSGTQALMLALEQLSQTTVTRGPQ